MTLKECNYSFNDPNFGNWDEINQKGVFARVENLNQTLDTINNLFPYAVWNYTSFQPPKQFFDNFGTYNPNGKWPYNTSSKIPFLNFKEGDNFLYVKCVNKIGNYRIFPMYFYPVYISSGGSGGVFITSDFNLSQGMIESQNLIKISYYQKDDPLNIFEAGLSQWNAVFTPNYIVNPMSSDNSYNNLINDGMYPNTELTSITYVNLTSIPSGIARSAHYFRENGHVDLYLYYPLIYFYVNSSRKISQISNSLRPSIQSLIFENKNTSKNCIITSGKCVNMLVLNPGEVINEKITLKNNYNFDLNSTILTYGIKDISQWYAGVGTFSLIDPRIKLFTKTNQKILNFSPNEVKEITMDFIIPDNVSMPFLYGESSLTRGGIAASYTPVIGYDNEGYLGFRSYDPKIVFSTEKNVPVFRVNLNLYSPTKNPNVKIYPLDYNLTFISSNELTKRVVDNFTIILNADEFIKMNNSNLPSDANGKYIPPGYDIPYTVDIPIDRSKYNENVNYLLDVFSIKNSGVFSGQTIARVETVPKFKSGESSFYSGSNQFEFANNSRNSTRYIMVFNPTFYYTEMNVSLIGLNNNFTPDFPSKIPLKPLEAKIIPITLNAVHNTWPAKDYKSSFSIKTIILDQDKNPTYNNLIYNIDLKNRSINNIDLAVVDLAFNNVDDIERISDSVELKSFWDTNGDISKNHGKGYNITLSIKEKDSGTVVDSFSLGYNISREATHFNKTKIFSNLDRIKKEYIASFSLDSLNVIGESDINDNSCENNNYKEITIPILNENPLTKECDKFQNMDLCNNKLSRSQDQQSFLCAWTSHYSSFSTEGSFCKSCSTIDRCMDYNNSFTCQLDPCQRANCNGVQKCIQSKCIWSTNLGEQKCLLKISDGGSDCIYDTNPVKTCEQGYDHAEIEYVLLSGPATCQKLESFSKQCNSVAMDFFDIKNFFIAMLAIIFIYIIIVIKNNN